jgi:molecular chaperone GrpE (heat shock protein)
MSEAFSPLLAANANASLPEPAPATDSAATAPEKIANALTAANLPQVQHRLVQMAQQIEQMHVQLAQLAQETQQSGEQVAILTRHLTSVQPLDSVHDQLATIASQLTAHQEQLAQLTGQLQGVARHDQIDALAQTLARAASQEQVAHLSEQIAPREQIDQLLQTAANREQLAQLDETFKRLSRTQFKANTLGETKEQQLQTALATLQELATRRAKAEEAQAARSSEQVENARRSARAELAAEFLPALDSLELALEHGGTFLKRQESQTHELVAQHQHYLTQIEDYFADQRQQVQRRQQRQVTASPGFWQRLLGVEPPPVSEQPLELPTPPQPISADALRASLQQTQNGLQAWLSGLQLIYERAAALLANEEIQPIDALYKPFDPRLHVAVGTAERSDLEPNQVVQVMRKGYRQRERVLRYAEVVVSRQPPST